MATNTPQLNWYQKCVNLAGQGAAGVGKGLTQVGSSSLQIGSSIASRAWTVLRDYWPPVAEKTRNAYGKIPFAIKVPLENVAKHPFVAGATAQAVGVLNTVKEEAPAYFKAGKETIDQLRGGDALSVLGQRFAFEDHQINAQPYKALGGIDQMVITFENRQPPGMQGVLPLIPPPGANPPLLALPANPVPALDNAGIPPHAAAATPAIGPRDPVVDEDRIAATDQQLKILSNHLKEFIPLFSMYQLGGIKDENPQSLTEMVREAITPQGNGKKSSAIDVFFKRYGNQLTRSQRWKIRIFNFFSPSSLFSKTVDSFMQTCLSEMRTRLSEARWFEQGAHIERVIEDLIYFLDVYKCAIFAYADAKELTGSLSQYRERAVEKMFGKPLAKICKEFSNTLMNNLFPNIKYFKGNWFIPRFVNWVLNKGVRMIVNAYLPNTLHSIVSEANDKTKPHNLPFVKALTDTAVDQLALLQGTLDQGPAPETIPLPGTKHLKDAIASLCDLIEFAHANTQESIQKTRKELEEKKKKPGLNATIQQGIQEAILKGTHVLFRYFAEPQNSEAMFTKFLELANTTFARGEVVTAEDLQMSKDKLDLTVRNLGKKLANEAIQDLFRMARPEQAEINAQAAFHAHQGDAMMTSIRLRMLSEAITQKMALPADQWTPERDILLELDGMRQLLKILSTKEQLSYDLKPLSPADQQSILLPLIPIYQSLEKQMVMILHLQEQQILQKSHSQLTDAFQEIVHLFDLMSAANPPENGLKQVPAFREVIGKVSKLLPPNAPEIVQLQQKIQVMTEALEGANIYKKNHDLLVPLEQKIQMLKFAIEQNRPDARRAALTEIRQILKSLPAQDEGALAPFIGALSDLKNPLDKEALNQAWINLGNGIGNIQQQYAANRNGFHQILVPHLRSKDWASQKKDAYRQLQLQNRQEMIREVDSLALEIGQFKNQVETVQRESQLKLTPHHFGIIGGTALGVLALFYPSLAAAIGAAAYAGVNQVAPLLEGGNARNAAGFKIGAQGLFGAGAAAAVASIPVVGVPLATLGVAIAAGAAGNRAIGGVIDGGQETVYQEINRFFAQVYEFAIGGAVYTPSAKIAMKQIIEAYKN